ncbi:MAG: hypothetical protein IKN63_04875 [Bacilli bacterium]|nr:hypothetical protein [Bacilli bacterium]
MLNKEININKKFILILILVNIIVLALYYSYALFEFNIIKNNVVTIKTGNINFSISTNIDNNVLTLAPNEEKEVVVTMTSTEDKIIGYQLFYTSNNLPRLKVLASEEYPDYIVKGTFLTSKEVTLTFKNIGLESVNLTIGGRGGLENFPIILNEGESEIEIFNSTGSMKLIEQRGKGGLVAVSNNGELAGDDNIREYRYSGGQDTVKNYIMFNKELWRIIGLFDDDQDGRYSMKIIRNEALSKMDSNLYTINQATIKSFNLGSEDSYSFNNKTYGRFFWNNPIAVTSNNYNDWTTAGLMYYLNEENKTLNGTESWYYTNYIKDDSINKSYEKYIEESTWYLGNVNVSSEGFVDETTETARIHERNSTICASDTKTLSNKANCYVWANNSPIWIGKVGLLSASDFGYAASSNNWNLGIMNEKKARSTISNNWLLSEDDVTYWMISPTSSDTNHVLSWSNSGVVVSSEKGDRAVRPVLNLKSSTPIVSGTGTYNDPYKIIEK